MKPNRSHPQPRTDDEKLEDSLDTRMRQENRSMPGHEEDAARAAPPAGRPPIPTPKKKPRR